jgi:hypothetical protein
VAQDPVRRIWTLSGSGLGTTIAAAGNSGNWPNLPATPAQLNAMTPVDLRWVDDLALFVNVGAIVGTPSLKVQLDGYDDDGNLFPAISGMPTAITAAGAAPPVYIGHHGGASGLFVVLPQWGRVSWTCTGGSCTGVEISLYGRGRPSRSARPRERRPAASSRHGAEVAGPMMRRWT